MVLGPVGILENLFVSSFMGAFIGGIFLKVSRKALSNYFAFGPYIIVVGTIQIFAQFFKITLPNFLFFKIF
jgi:prepilin signal peptidase PulO-like enzyme (type II secretory pathway)